jgi:hypothetical protein
VCRGRNPQDCLVKELRLAGISEMDSGNTFLPRFVERMNERFVIRATKPDNLHLTLWPCSQLREESVRHGHVRQVGINSAYSFLAQGTHSRQMFIKHKVVALCRVI